MTSVIVLKIKMKETPKTIKKPKKQKPDAAGHAINSLSLSNSDSRAKCGDFYPRITGEFFEVSPLAQSGSQFWMFSLSIF